MIARIRCIVRKDSSGEYVKHDGRIFRIRWGVDKSICPSPQYPVMAIRNAGYNAQWSRKSLDLFRYPEGTEWLGGALEERNEII